MIRHSYDKENDFQKCVKYSCMIICCPCFSIYYILKAIWEYCLEKCLSWILDKIIYCLEFLCRILEKICDCLLKSIEFICKPIYILFSRVSTVIYNVCDSFFQCVLKCLNITIVPCLRAINIIFIYIFTAIKIVLIWIYEKILTPIGYCIQYVCLKTWDFLKFIYIKFIEPIRICFIYICKEIIYEKIIIPFYGALKCFLRCLKWIYVKIIKPILKFLDYIILNPIRIAYRAIKRFLNAAWDIFDDALIEIFYSGDEYIEKKMEKQEKKIKKEKKEKNIYPSCKSIENVNFKSENQIMSLAELATHQQIIHSMDQLIQIHPEK